MASASFKMRLPILKPTTYALSLMSGMLAFSYKKSHRFDPKIIDGLRRDRNDNQWTQKLTFIMFEIIWG